MLLRKYFSPRRLPNPVWFSFPLFTPGPDALVLTLTSHILTGGNSRKPNFISGVIRKAELLPLASHSTTESPGRLFPRARNRNITNKRCQHLVKMSYPELALADERLLTQRQVLWSLLRRATLLIFMPVSSTQAHGRAE